MNGRTYLWCVNVIGMCVVSWSFLRVISIPPDPTWLLLAVLALVSGATVLRLPFVAASFSVGDAFSFAALFLYGVDAATLTVALDTLAISLRIKGSATRTIFNVAAPSLALWTAGTVVFGLLALPLPVDASSMWLGAGTTAISAAIMFGLNTALVAGAIATHEDTAVGLIWRRYSAQYWPNLAACGYIGVLIAIGVRQFGPAALIAVVPIPLILYLAFRAVLGRMNDHRRHLDEVNGMLQSTIEAFATAVDAKDQVTHGHIRRVQTFSLALARDLHVNDAGTMKALEAAALLHDVGKIGIPEHILNKPGRLTPSEFEEMKRHVTIGAGILSTIAFPFPVLRIVEHHHENWDGSGYPAGVRGEDIPLGARILSVVDCFDALTSDRPYRAAMSVRDAFDILRARRGSMYDPAIVDRFMAVYPTLSCSTGEERTGPAEVAVAKPGVSADHRTQLAADPVDMAQVLLRVVSAALPNDLCVAYAQDAQSHDMVAVAAAGPGAGTVLGHRVRLAHGVSGWVASTGKAMHETDAVLDFPGIPSEHRLSSYRCSSVLFPSDGTLVVSVYGPTEHGADRVRVLEDVARVAADARQGAASKRDNRVPS